MITLEKVLEILREDENFHEIIFNGEYFFNWERPVSFDSLSYDSRKTNENTLFFAKGARFKRDYLLNIAASFYISEIDHEVTIPVIIVSDVKQALALIAQAFYDYPSKKLKTLAITGTKGKTTTAYFAKSILDEFNGGKTALLSTAESSLDGKIYFKSLLTTPESLDLARMMAEAVENGMTHLVMEVSSQAYLTERVYGLTFDVGAFLNISPDHIGPIEHPSFENYFYCKRQLIKHSRYFVANSQMAGFELVKGEIGELEHAFYGENTPHYDIRLLGQFNQENAQVAALCCQRFGASDEQIRSGLAKTVVPGRMEAIQTATGSTIYVDYAHNGVSLQKLLQVVEAAHPTGTIALVLGATGNKGESRRKDFGLVLEQHPRIDPIFLTTDDSNYEDSDSISAEIASYISRPVSIEKDRQKAIQLAIQTEAGVVVIAGKGADKFQLLNGKREPYPGDAEVVKKILTSS